MTGLCVTVSGTCGVAGHVVRRAIGQAEHGAVHVLASRTSDTLVASELHDGWPPVAAPHALHELVSVHVVA